MKCPRCGLINEQGRLACLRCGLPFPQQDADAQLFSSPVDRPRAQRAPYSSPLGRAAEPMDATWREESGALEPSQMAAFAITADEAPETPETAPAFAPDAPRALPEPQPAPPQTPVSPDSPPNGAQGIPTFLPDDNPPPWLTQALRAQGRMPTSDPASPGGHFSDQRGARGTTGASDRAQFSPQQAAQPWQPNSDVPPTRPFTPQSPYGHIAPNSPLPQTPRVPGGRMPDPQQRGWANTPNPLSPTDPSGASGASGPSGISGRSFPAPYRFPLNAPPDQRPGYAPFPLGQAPFGAQHALEPGTMLKGGRYRLLRRFDDDPTQVAMLANAPESAWPLMIASDSDTPGAGVLIQELPLRTPQPHGVASLANTEAIERRRILITARLRAIPPGAGATVIDSFSERGRHFLVFEEPGGDLLSDRIQRARGPLVERTVVEYTLHIVEALMSLAEGRPPLAHGALSPTHIVLRPNGSVTLVGFSPNVLATADGAAGAHAVGPSGVPGYAAPEQARGQVTTRSDIYALGMIMRHMATGVPPWRQTEASTQAMRRLNPTLSLEFEEIVNRATRPAASQRFLSLEEMRRALQALVTRAPGRVSNPRLATGLTGLLPDMPELTEGANGRDGSARTQATRGRGTPLSQNPFFLVAIVFVLIALVGAGLVVFSQRIGPHLTPQTNNGPTPNPGIALYQQQGIGISAGEFVFDKQQPDNTLKEEAVRALAVGDQQTAFTDYHQALSTDISDAEAAIYAADIAIELHGTPYVTIAVGVAFSDAIGSAGPTDQDVAARDQLQGVYLAQQTVNNSHVLPEGVQVRILIVNSGPDVAGVGSVAQLLANQIRNGNTQHIVGLISWPELAQTQAAAMALQHVGLPIIGTAIGLDALTPTPASPTPTAATPTPTPATGAINTGNYFAIVPTETQQGAELADAAVLPQQLGYSRILLAVDTRDPTSVALAQGFTKELATLQENQKTGATLVSRQSMTPGSAASYNAVAQTAQKQAADLLLVAGTDQDTVGLAQETYRLGGVYHILTGAEADTPSLFGQGSDPLAQIARQNPEAFGNVYVTSLADAFEAVTVNDPNVNQLLFDQNYLSLFGQSGIPSGLLNPDPGSILAYDALTVLAEATPINNQTGQSGQSGSSATPVVYPTLAQVRSSLLGNNHQQGFQGVSGSISFSLDGDQLQKAMAILKLTPNLDASASAPIATTSVLLVVGGKQYYCGATSCK